MIKKVILITMALCLCVLLIACKANPSKQVVQEVDHELESETSTVNLLISKDFGNQIIYEAKLEYNEGDTIYDIMVENLELDTEYGGSFVSGINGLVSQTNKGTRLDWFYFINGISADVGILDYDLVVGDEIWWDYHEWKSMGAINSSVIGSYPGPFTNGYRGQIGETTLLVNDTNSQLVSELKQYLLDQGVSKIIVKKLSETAIVERSGPTIVIGMWNELKDYKTISNLNEEFSKVGTYIFYNELGVTLMDTLNEEAMNLQEGVGTIYSHGEGLGDDAPLWLVSGTDSVGLELALDTMINKPQALENAYSLAITKDEIIKLPVN